jgi:hypothetical protein
MPQGARSGKAALSTAIGDARVTLPISRSSPGRAMAIRFVRSAAVPIDSPLATLALRDPERAESTGAATQNAFVAARR